HKGLLVLRDVVRCGTEYKHIVGRFILEFVEALVGKKMAREVACLLLCLPLEDIHVYLVDYNNFELWVEEALRFEEKQRGCVQPMSCCSPTGYVSRTNPRFAGRQ